MYKNRLRYGNFIFQNSVPNFLRLQSFIFCRRAKFVAKYITLLIFSFEVTRKKEHKILIFNRSKVEFLYFVTTVEEISEFKLLSMAREYESKLASCGNSSSTVAEN